MRWGNKGKWLIIKPPKAEELHTVQLGVVMREGDLISKGLACSISQATSHLRSLQAIVVLRGDVVVGKAQSFQDISFGLPL